MATRRLPAASEREARFFFVMACVMAATIVIGFGANVATGQVTFAAQPWYAHLHAFVFFGWTALYVVQNGLVASGNVAIHRRLGWLALAWVPAMVVLGIVLTINGVRYKPLPPPAPALLIMMGNLLQMLVFAALVLSAIALRRRTAVHRRLIYIATSALTTQALGRLAPFIVGPGPLMPLFVTPSVMAFSVAGAIHDKFLYGRIHPLWWFGIALQPLQLIAAGAITSSPPGMALLHLLLDGTPGAARIPALP